MDACRAYQGERRVVEARGSGKAMADALADILKWERVELS